MAHKWKSKPAAGLDRGIWAWGSRDLGRGRGDPFAGHGGGGRLLRVLGLGVLLGGSRAPGLGWSARVRRRLRFGGGAGRGLVLPAVPLGGEGAGALESLVLRVRGSGVERRLRSGIGGHPGFRNQGHEGPRPKTHRRPRPTSPAPAARRDPAPRSSARLPWPGTAPHPPP